MDKEKGSAPHRGLSFPSLRLSFCVNPRYVPLSYSLLCLLGFSMKLVTIPCSKAVLVKLCGKDSEELISTNWHMGRALKSAGKYDEAIERYMAAKVHETTRPLLMKANAYNFPPPPLFFLILSSRL